MSQYLSLVKEVLNRADVQINGARSWDIQVHDQRLFSRVCAQGSRGLGEAYMDGWWDCQQLDEFFFRILRADIKKYVRPSLAQWWALITCRIMNLQSVMRAYRNGQHHYDLGNDIYQAMLDSSLTYTCGYWPQATNLDQAQEAKLDLVCRKINLQPGQTVLDIGCGWGSFAYWAAKHYGAHVTGVTIAQEQVTLAMQKCAGLPVEIKLQDYRHVTGTFDHVISLGMFEHVGYKNYRTFMELISRVLKDDGFFLLHTIGGNKTEYTGDAWIDKYIFPGGMLPSIAQIGSSIEELFVMEDWHNFGANYDRTLLAWYANFEKQWPALSKKYDQRFYRMWRYYLLMCAALFRARQCQLWQIVLTKRGKLGGYIRVT